MKRRRFITSTGLVIGTVGLAGCVGDSDDSGNDQNGNGVGNGNSDGDENGSDENGGSDIQPAPDLERVDEPPHEPEKPPRDGPDEWVETWMGHGMATEPSLPFEGIDLRPSESELASVEPGEYSPSYAVTVVDSAEALTTRFENPDEFDISFDEEVVLHVESGWGSSSVHHGWSRAESHEEGIHLHGYYTDPLVRTDDYTSRHSVLVVERPAAEVDTAHVSLTVGEDRRVNFDSTQGAVSLPEDE